MPIPSQFLNKEFAEIKLLQQRRCITSVEVHPQPLVSRCQARQPERADDLRFARVFFIVDQAKPILFT